MEKLKRKSVDILKTFDDNDEVKDIIDVNPLDNTETLTTDIKLSEEKLKAINNTYKPTKVEQSHSDVSEKPIEAKPFSKVREDTVVTFIPKGYEVQTITSNGVEYDVVFANVDSEYTLEKLYMREFLEHLLEKVFSDE